MRYRIGELRERITLQSKTRTRDTLGGFTDSWTDEDTVWALVRPASGKERSYAEQQEAQSNYKIVIRRRTVDAEQRFLWRDIPLNIRFIADRGPHSPYLEIDAERGVET